MVTLLWAKLQPLTLYWPVIRLHHQVKKIRNMKYLAILRVRSCVLDYKTIIWITITMLFYIHQPIYSTYLLCIKPIFELKSYLISHHTHTLCLVGSHHFGEINYRFCCMSYLLDRAIKEFKDSHPSLPREIPLWPYQPPSDPDYFLPVKIRMTWNNSAIKY